jgi:hypothetical protein
LLSAVVSPIDDFDKEFHINYENPFVPYHERVADRNAQDPKVRPPRNPKTPTVKVPAPTPDAPITPVQKPTLKLPPRKPNPTELEPECIGILRHGPSQQAVVMTRLKSEDEPAPLAVGDAIEGWIVRDIGNGLIRFERPDGTEVMIPVGSADTNVQGDDASTGGTTAPSTKPSGNRPQSGMPNGQQPVPAGEPRMRKPRPKMEP